MPSKSRANSLEFLVTGCARSGTSRLAAALTAAGTPTAHERLIRPPAGRLPDVHDYRGEVSWRAAPFIHVHPEIPVYLMYRHPFRTIESFAAHIGPGRVNLGLGTNREIVSALAPEEPPATGIAFAAWYWVRWHQMILRQLEEGERAWSMCPTPHADTLVRLLAGVSEAEALRAYNEAPKNQLAGAQRRTRDSLTVTLDDIPEHLVEDLQELTALFGLGRDPTETAGAP